MKWYLAIYTGYDHWEILDMIEKFQAKSKKQAKKIVARRKSQAQDVRLYGPFKKQPVDLL